MITKAESPLYRADLPDCWPQADLDGIIAYFHAPSGQTHLLVEPALTMLMLLAGPEGSGLDTLIAALCHRLDVEPDDAVRQTISARLAELESAGLVWQV